MLLEQKTQNRRAVAYVRVSSKRQAEEGVSIDVQIERIKSYASFKELELSDDDIFIDDGVSAATHLWSRPEGSLMHRLIYEEQVPNLICLKMDRLFRDVQDCLSTVDELGRIEVNLHLLEFSGQALDTSSAIGRFFLTMVAALAEMERGQISERTKLAMNYLKENCKVFCYDIFGWDKTEEGNIVPNWSEQDVIAWMKWAYHTQGKTSTWIANHLNEKSVKGKRGGSWQGGTVMRTMRYDFHEKAEKFPKPDWWNSRKWNE
jgi:DNA invertase Pin-like site-specific DNA recombinase